MANTTETLRQIIKVDGIDKASKDVNQLKGNIDNSNQSLINMGLKFVSVGLAVKTLTDSYKAFIVQRDAINKVELAINNMGLQSSITTEAVENIASELQSLTNYGDEETLGKIFQPLILAGVDSVDTMKSIGMTILDIADGTGRSMESISTQITGLISGASKEVTELARATGISQETLKRALEGTNTATERAIALQDVLGGKFKGMAGKSVDPLKQLQNTIGDVKEELGKAFYPLIKTLADSAKSFLENKNNVDSLITTVKVLTASFAGLQAIKFGGNLVNQFKNVGAGFGILNDNIDKLSKIKTEISPIKFDIERLEREIKTAETSLTRLSDLDALFKKMNASGGFVDKGLPKIYNETSLEASKLAKEHQKLTLKSKELSTQFNSVGKSALSSSLSLGKAALSLVGWVGVAYSAFTIVNQLGKSFGWWGKEIKKVNVEIEKNFEKIDNLVSKLKSINTDEVISAEEFEALNKEVNEFNKTYGTTIDLLSEDKTLSEQANLAKKKSIELMNEERLALLESARQRLFIKSIGKTYNEEQQKNLDNALKGYDDEIIRLKKLMMANKELDKVKGNARDISALSKYYEKARFGDSNYYEWRVKMNEKELEDFKNLLKDKGFNDDEIKKHSADYEKQLNKELRDDRKKWFEEQSSMLDEIAKKTKELKLSEMFKMSDMIGDDTSWYDAYQKRKEALVSYKEALVSYYDTVGTRDKNYYDYKKQLIEDDIDAQLKAGLINDDQAKLLQKKRMEDLLMEKEAYQNYFAMVNNGIQGMSDSLLAFARVTAKSNNDIAKAWYALADAVIAQLKRMVTQMVVNFIWQQMLNLTGFGSIKKGIPTGTGEGLPMGGNIASFPTGNGVNGIQSPVVNTNRSNNTSIINRLERLENSIVDAINKNSIKGKITTIDRVVLAKEIDVVNKRRSVL